jgi:hypothetical protein
MRESIVLKGIVLGKREKWGGKVSRREAHEAPKDWFRGRFETEPRYAAGVSGVRGARASAPRQTDGVVAL